MVAALSMAVATARAVRVANLAMVAHAAKATALAEKASREVMALAVNNAVPVVLVKAANVMVRVVMAATEARVVTAAKVVKAARVARAATPPRVEDVIGRNQCRATVALP
jgi:hypothetical protein